MVNRICELIKKRGMSISAVEKQLGFGNGAIKRFEKNSPSIDKIISLSNFLNVSIDYLVYGKDCFNNANISNSNVVECFHEKTNTSLTSKTEVDNKTQTISETSKEMLEVFEKLPTRERIKLLNIIYNYEEEYEKNGSVQIKQISNTSVHEQQLLEIFKQFSDYEQVKIIERVKEWLDVKHRREHADSQRTTNTQTEFSNQTRIVARSFDGTYENRLATPEELEKMKLLKDAPEPEY